jgi:uncharacterized protein YqgC (DUF456 family)
MLETAVVVAMVVGLVGTIVPVIPGLLLIAGAALGYGIVEGFGTTGTIAMAVVVALGIAGTVAGFVVPQRTAGTAGATRTSMLLGVVGAIVGFIVLPVVGTPIGGALGIYLGERIRTGAHEQAWRATVATLKGFGVGALVQLAAGLGMVLAWVAWAITT